MRGARLVGMGWFSSLVRASGWSIEGPAHVEAWKGPFKFRFQLGVRK